ncbi:MAG: hypothetical protein MUF04_04050 [Akkermansiaceae bacterium]|nr:hypothetical protein [Akkermansiaceae bacterium]
MMTTVRFLAAPVLLFLGLASAMAGTVFSTNFASHVTGAATAASLNAVTTGGTWYLNPSRGATYEIQDSAGDKALLLDDPDASGNNNAIQFGGVFLTKKHLLADGDMTWTFRTASRRTGTNKALRFEFINWSDSAVAATINWYEGGLVNLNPPEDNGNSPFTFLHPWNHASTAVRDVSVTFSGTTVSLTFGGVSLVGTVQNGATDIGRLRVYSINSAVDARGLFLDDITVTTITPDTNPPKITSFTSVGGGLWELTLTGVPGASYEFRSSTTLNFNPGTLVENLTQGNPGTDAGTIGGTNNSRVATDANGNAKVRLALTGTPSNFVRAEQIP